MINLKDWLPDFKGALNSFYEEKIKEAFESKSTEYKELFTKHLEQWERTQRALLIIALGVFFLLLIAYFWNPNFNQNNMQKQLTKWETLSYASKYIAIGIILRLVVPYAWKAIKNSTTKNN